MKALIEKFNGAFAAIPHDLIAIVARIGIGTTFFQSGLTKINGYALAITGLAAMLKSREGQ